MDNNSTNFNKANNHLSLQLIELNKKTTTYITLEIQVLMLVRHKNMAVSNRVMSPKSSPFVVCSL
jgi:hypothetical protein